MLSKFYKDKTSFEIKKYVTIILQLDIDLELLPRLYGFQKLRQSANALRISIYKVANIVSQESLGTSRSA